MGQPPDLVALGRTLEARWHAEIPISAAMGIAVAGFAGRHLDLRAALEPNVNVHGTAFAGSLFSVAALCGWGLVHLQLQRQDLDGDIVFVEGRIRCLKPVREDVTARCAWGSEAEVVLDGLPRTGRGRFVLTTRLDCADGLAAEFSGEYAVRLKRQ
jgi:thioesterase domain-containing protein